MHEAFLLVICKSYLLFQLRFKIIPAPETLSDYSRPEEAGRDQIMEPVSDSEDLGGRQEFAFLTCS
jgi:hypothetical protein